MYPSSGSTLSIFVVQRDIYASVPVMSRFLPTKIKLDKIGCLRHPFGMWSSRPFVKRSVYVYLTINDTILVRR